MKTHKFSVNVPNPTDKPVDVKLSLKAASIKDISGALPPEVSKSQLQILKAGISLDACKGTTKKSLNLKLKPFSSVQVYVMAESADSKKQAVAGFHIVDTRKSKTAGGVLLICSNASLTEPAGVFITSPNCCPAVLVKKLYGVNPGEDVTRPRFRAIPSGKEIELIAQIINPTAKPLQDIKIYLEHLGGANAEFSPGTWNAGILNKGDVFYASWKLQSSNWLRSEFAPSIVVSSQGSEPVRLTSKISFESDSLNR